MIQGQRPANDYKPYAIDDFGFGLMTRDAPSQIPHGAALVSYDADYDSRSIKNRRGYDSVLENGPGATKIADFEVGEAWSGGSADTVNFVKTEAAADGTRSRSISAVGGAGEVAVTLTVALNLGTDPLEVINLWILTTAFPAGVTGYTLTLRFQTSNGNYYQVTAASNSDSKNPLELNLSKYHRFRRQDFAKTGAPDWTNITQIRLGLTAVGAGTLTISVDNLHRTPGFMQDLFQFRRESGSFKGASSEYAITNGTLYRNDGQRWTSVFSGFVTDQPIYSVTAQDRRLISDGVTSPRILLGDGATVYRLGIVGPPRQVIATQIGLTAAQVAAGGGLPDGDYFVQVLYYSSKTGTFSAPDERVPATASLTIAGGGGIAGIRFSNLPVSSDPQVDWLVIGIRPADVEAESFFRISDGAFGDAANGTITVDFVGSISQLQSRRASIIDPDLDYPSVIDPATGLPTEGHPIYLVGIGGYIVAVMAEELSVVRWSRFRAPGSWRIDDEEDVGENDDDPVTALGVNASTLFVFKGNSVIPGRAVGGDEGISFSNKVSDDGCTDHKAIMAVGNFLLYPGEDAAYMVGPDLVTRPLTSAAQPTWRGLWNHQAKNLGAAIRLRDRHQVAFFKRSKGAFRNDSGWVTHYQKMIVPGGTLRVPDWAPTIWRMPVDVGAEVRLTGDSYEPWIGGLGQVFRANYGTQDDARDIVTVHRTALVTTDRHFVHLFLYADLEGDVAGAVNAQVAVFLGRALTADSTVAAALQGGADVLGTFVLGTDQMGAPAYVHDRVKLGARVAVRYLCLEVTLRGRAEFDINRITIWSKPVSRWREKQ